jgi:hypothetical protein
MLTNIDQQFAQVRKALEERYGYREAFAALSAIERHVQDVETALRNLIEWADNERGTDFGEREWNEARAALPAREKGTE